MCLSDDIRFAEILHVRYVLNWNDKLIQSFQPVKVSNHPMLHSFLSITTRVTVFSMCVASALLGHLAHACKYSVRDVAFVDLTQESHAFLTISSGSVLDAVKARIQPVATAVFLDSNIRTGWLSSEDAVNHPGFQSNQGRHSFNGAFLYRDGLKPLPLMTPDEVNDVDASRYWSRMERAVHSPIRQQAVEHLLSAYAVILIVETKDVQENARVRLAAQSAAATLAKMIPEMPKPVDVPPQVVVVPYDMIQAEEAMLWGLEMTHLKPDKPQVAVLIGRGRRLGPTLKGDEITAGKLQQILAVAGQDCECDLDRSWMQGPMIPVRWGPDRQQSAYNNLGFDPDNPLVKAEISRILARGKNPIRVNGTDSIGSDLDMLLLGYSEEVLSFDESTIESSPTPAEPEAAETITSSEVSPIAESKAIDKKSVPGISKTGVGRDTSSTETLPFSVVADEHPPSSPRSVLSMLSGLCIFAIVGGLVVLITGRSRK